MKVKVLNLNSVKNSKMIDFTITDYTRWGNIYCSIFFFLIYLIYWKKCTSPIGSVKISAYNTLWLFLLIAVFSITSFYNGDFFHYMMNVKTFYPGMPSFHLEKIYEYIIIITHNNYLLFRTVIWTSALFIYVLTLRQYKINTLCGMYVMFILFVTIFCYARVSLAMSILFYGIAIFSNTERSSGKLKSIGLVIILSSYFFHKSMIITILLSLFYYIPINSISIIPILISFIVFGLSYDNITQSFIGLLTGSLDEQLDEKLNYLSDNAMERKQIKATFFGWIMEIWRYGSFYYTAFVIFITIIRKETLSVISREMIGLFRITMAIILFATTLLVFSSQSLTFFYRYLYMSFIPLSILTVYLYHNGILAHKSFKKILFVGSGYYLSVFLMNFL